MRNKFKKLRREIQKLDASIVKAIYSRLTIAKRIGALKIRLKMPITDPLRENQQKKLFIKLAKKYKIHPSLLLNIFKVLIDESKRVQKYVKKS